MADPARQLVLDLPVEPRFGREDFLVGPSNRAAYAFVEAWRDWPGGLARLEGPPGSGKSHLAAIWADATGAWTVAALDIAEQDVPHLVSAPALVIEDLGPEGADEAALFHLVNLLRERGVPLLVTGASGIEECGIRTPDLTSRLRLAAVARLGPPGDELIRSVLVKLFTDRQLTVDHGTVEYVAMRIERSLARAREVVAELDRESLSRGRRVTRQVASAVLAVHDEGAADDEAAED